MSRNVCSNAQPIGIEVVIPNPALQVGEPRGERRTRRNNWLWRTEPQEIATVVKQNLWAEEVMTRREIDRSSEDHINLNLLSGHLPLTASKYVGRRVNAVHNRVRGCESGSDNSWDKRQSAAVAVARCAGYFNISGRVHPGRNLRRRKSRRAAGAPNVRVLGKYMVELNLNLRDGNQRIIERYQPPESGRG